VSAWRLLTGGRRVRDPARRTLVACSGGADSSALALVLGRSAPGSVVLAHILHDLRPAAEAAADRDAAASLAARLGVPFAERAVTVLAVAGNAEAAARRARYAALEGIAGEHRCRFVATAHHGDDLVETVLMRLMRGAGPGGLAGLRPSRPLSTGSGVHLVRPMLGVTHADARGICAAAGWTWAVDRTNADLTRLRAALRADVLPRLRALSPQLHLRVGAASELLAETEALARPLRAALLARADRRDGELAWRRTDLREEPAVIVGAVLRAAAAELVGDRGQDRLGARVVRTAVRAVLDAETHPRRFAWPGIDLLVDAHAVTLVRLG